MRILHIAGGFAQHSLYPKLVQNLSVHCDFQTIFAAVRSSAEADRQPADVPETLEYHFRNILSGHHRIFFREKIRVILRELLTLVDPASFSVIHAHTLYSDGVVALRLKEQYGVPFIVAVRNTDLNVFYRYRPDLRRLAKRVLSEASHVIVLSPAYRTLLLEKFGSSVKSLIDEKLSVLPNGLSAEWLEGGVSDQAMISSPIRLLFVGTFSKNKNIQAVLEAAAIVSSEMPLHLTLVGSGGDHESWVRKVLRDGEYPFVEYLGRVDDSKKLREIYRQHDILVVPSFKETFGLVYIEALSQGVCVIHSERQGIDGYFPGGNISEAVDPSSVADIAQAIIRLSGRARSIKECCITAARPFAWGLIAESYDAVYRVSAALRPVMGAKLEPQKARHSEL